MIFRIYPQLKKLQHKSIDLQYELTSYFIYIYFVPNISHILQEQEQSLGRAGLADDCTKNNFINWFEWNCIIFHGQCFFFLFWLWLSVLPYVYLRYLMNRWHYEKYGSVFWYVSMFCFFMTFKKKNNNNKRKISQKVLVLNVLAKNFTIFTNNVSVWLYNQIVNMTTKYKVYKSVTISTEMYFDGRGFVKATWMSRHLLSLDQS